MCVRWPRVEATDATTGYAQTWPTAGATIPCGVLRRGKTSDDGSTSDALLDGRIVRVPYGTTVQVGDKLAWAGVWLDVLDVRSEGTHSVDVALDCVEGADPT